MMKGDHGHTNRLHHIINWGALDHASDEPQLISYMCTCTYSACASCMCGPVCMRGLFSNLLTVHVHCMMVIQGFPHKRNPDLPEWYSCSFWLKIKIMLLNQRSLLHPIDHISERSI